MNAAHPTLLRLIQEAKAENTANWAAARVSPPVVDTTGPRVIVTPQGTSLVGF